jgi:hypothetical protein
MIILHAATLYDWFQSTQNKLTSIDSQFASAASTNLIDVVIPGPAASPRLLRLLCLFSSSSSAGCMISDSDEDNDDDDNDDDDTAAQQLQGSLSRGAG